MLFPFILRRECQGNRGSSKIPFQGCKLCQYKKNLLQVFRKQVALGTCISGHSSPLEKAIALYCTPFAEVITTPVGAEASAEASVPAEEVVADAQLDSVEQLIPPPATPTTSFSPLSSLSRKR